MTKKYRVREASITAVDTRTAVVFLASATAESPASIPVPKDHPFLLEVIAAVGPDFAAVGSAGFFLRLEGDGLKVTPIILPIAGAGNNVATGGQAILNPQRLPGPWDVVPGNNITVSAEMVGADIGTVAVGVCLVFGTEIAAPPGPVAGAFAPLTLEGDVLLADTFAALTTRGSETTPSRQIPVGASKILALLLTTTVDLAAAGSAVFILRLGGNAISGGSHEIIIAGGGGQVPQAGSDVAPKVAGVFYLENADIPVSGGETISIEAAMTDNDLGTARVTATLIFA